MELDSRLVEIVLFYLFFAVDIAPFQEFCCLSIKAIGFVLLDFTQLRGNER